MSLVLLLVGVPARAQDDELAALRRELEHLRARIQQLEKRRETPSKEASTPAREEAQPLLQAESRGERDRRRAEMAGQGPLLSRGEWEMSPGIRYGFYSNNKLTVEGFSLLPFFVAGNIQSGQHRRDIVTATSGFALGISKRFQVEADLAVVRRSEELLLADGTVQKAQRSGLGDLRLGLTTHLNTGGKSGWILLGHFDLMVPTGADPFHYDAERLEDDDLPLGSGFWTTQARVTAVRQSDPAVLFATAGVSYSFSEDVDTSLLDATVSPGMSWEYGLGVAIAMNYQLSLGLQVQHRIREETAVNGVDLDNSSVNDARLSVDAQWLFKPGRKLSVSVGAGLSEDAPDFTLSFGTVMKFGDR